MEITDWIACVLLFLIIALGILKCLNDLSKM